MVKDGNVRVMITVPVWLIDEFKKTSVFNILGGQNLSQCIRMYMLSVISEEEIINQKKV